MRLTIHAETLKISLSHYLRSALSLFFFKFCMIILSEEKIYAIFLTLFNSLIYFLTHCRLELITWRSYGSQTLSFQTKKNPTFIYRLHIIHSFASTVMEIFLRAKGKGIKFFALKCAWGISRKNPFRCSLTFFD